MSNLVRRFTEIWQRNDWACAETRSGGGSTLAFTENIRQWLPGFLRNYRIRSMLDAGCGDFHWMAAVDLGEVLYQGWDVVEDLIRENIRLYGNDRIGFTLGDITRPYPATVNGAERSTDLPKVDMILCRAVLFHLSLLNIEAAIHNFRLSGSRWLLATTHPHVQNNWDIENGDWRRLNLEPFLGPPAALCVADGPGDDGYLALWELNS